MNSLLLTQTINEINQKDSIEKLEAGSILFFPQHHYAAVDPLLLSETILHKTHKNVSFDYKKMKLGAYNKNMPELEHKLIALMKGYAEFAVQIINQALPAYSEHLIFGRTSFRPAQIKGRVSSKRKDDTRLHVDSFPASPVNGLRILRVFCNVNPYNESRIWNVGEPFPKVLHRFAPNIHSYNKLIAKLLHWVKTTKTLRSPYDHYMLHLHDIMKLDDHYQSQVQKTRIDFPSQSTWIVFTDHVSHAALSGQHLLEQTFYLPVKCMAQPQLSPLYEWHKLKPEISV